MNDKLWDFPAGGWATNGVSVSYAGMNGGVYGVSTVQYQNPPRQIFQYSTQTTDWLDTLAGMQYRWATGNYYPWSAIYNTQPPETLEEMAEREKRRVKRKAAECRAEKLLFSILTPTQVKQYTDDDYFEVPVNERIYRIKKGVSRNVELIEAGKRTALYCAHPKDAYDVPVPDVMLSQLLMLRSSEAEFLRIANKTVLQ